jgi:hypothetical protein
MDNHIHDERLIEFASEILDLTLDENIHLDDCSACWHRLVDAIKFVVLKRTEEKKTKMVVEVLELTT